MPELTAKYWRDRAAATAAKADHWFDDRQRARLLRVAREYDKLADAAASRGLPEAEKSLAEVKHG